MVPMQNLIAAIVLSIGILLGFHYFYERPRLMALQAEQQIQQQADQALTPMPDQQPAITTAERSRLLSESAGSRAPIHSDRLHGSINLVGARIDDLTLATYRATIDPASPEIVLFAPAGSAAPDLPYYAEFGWLAAGGSPSLPDAQSRWEATSATPLGAGGNLRLFWQGENIRIERDIRLDDGYLFTVTDHVRNLGQAAISVQPFALISRHGLPPVQNLFILHEGPLGVLDGTLDEHPYKELRDDRLITYQEAKGWIGITDKYWLSALLPAPDAVHEARFVHGVVQQQERFQTDLKGGALTIAPGAEISHTIHLFAGAKEVALLDRYEQTLGIRNLDLAIDFGWFYFLTKPFFYLLDWLGGISGNFGVAILIFTLLLKLAFFPVANLSYESITKMKAVHPELTALRERLKDDPQRLSEEMMAVYKREKINPLAGCLPIIPQVIVFFALYKVLFVSIELRHAPFFGWIQDLAAPDPTSIFNLFGLIPWDPPGLLMIGLWPILMGIAMWAQQKLAPAPPDPVQAKIFEFLPILFTFMLAQMAAGLVIYWTLSSVLSILQQWWIMRKMGVPLSDPPPAARQR